MARSRTGIVTLEDIKKEVAKRQKTVDALAKRRARLLDELGEVDGELRRLGGVIGANGRIVALTGPGRKRPRNEMNLANSLAKVLANKAMSVTEVAEAVQEAGYATTSPNFRTIVNQTLIKDRRFKRVSRGRYTVNKK